MYEAIAPSASVPVRETSAARRFASGTMDLAVALLYRARAAVRWVAVMKPLSTLRCRKAPRAAVTVASAGALLAAVEAGGLAKVSVLNLAKSVGLKPRQASVKRSLF